MRWLTDTRILVAAIVGIIVVGIISVIAMPPPPAPPLSVRSAEPDGAMALSLWLEESGYTVKQVLSNPIKFGETDVLFILDPLVLYTEDEAQRIHDWVAEGHTLIVAGNYPFILNQLLGVFDVSLHYIPSSSDMVLLSAPTLLTPPVQGVHADSVYKIEAGQGEVVTHLVHETAPVLVSFGVEQGVVWVAGIQTPFTNQGLKNEGSAQLIMNLLAGVPADAVIGFDEARHGFQEASASLSGWLVGSSAGWAILSGIFLVMVYLGLRGRRFGRAVPIPEERLRREPVEYIQAIATLFQRSGQQEAMLKHYSGQLRRRLSERYAVDPKMRDEVMVKTIAGRDPNVDETELQNLFARLRRNKLSEQELLETVTDVDTWLRKIS
jgi:hypothetical protein